MPSFNDVLKDATRYPDTTEWTLPDGTKTTVGELRTELRNTFIPKDDFTRGQQKAAEERRLLEQDYNTKLYAMQQQQLALQQQLQRGTQNPNAAGDDLDTYVNDPIWGPVAKRLKSSLERSEKLETQLKETQKRLADHEQVWWLNQHAQVLKRIQDSDPDMKDQTKVNEFLGFAKNNGFSNLDTAYSLYTRDRDIERARETASKEAYERAKTELSAPRVPSGASQSGSTIAPAPTLPASIDEAEVLAKSDPEIARLMEGLPA